MTVFGPTTEELLTEAERLGYILDRDGVLPHVLPASWNERRHPEPHHALINRFWHVSTRDGVLRVMAGLERHGDRRWIHISASRRERLPSWDDLKLVKRVLAGPERQAIQVIPRESEYVNIHPNCLHLFVCIDEDPVPCFSKVIDGKRQL
jgi:hypothetical protein